MAQPDIKPVLFVGKVRFVPFGGRGAVKIFYCVARFKDEQTLIGLVPGSDFKEILKRAKGYLRSGAVRKAVYVSPSGNFASTDGTIRYVFEALGREELKDAQRYLAP